MEAPPNTGPDYTRQFREVYRDVAARHQATLLPFLLEGVAGETALEPGRRHPSESARARGASPSSSGGSLEPVIEARERAATE